MAETPPVAIHRNCFERNHRRLSTFSVVLWCLSAAISSVPLTHSQEALRNSLAGEAAAEAHVRQMESQPYTLKKGDFKLLVTPSMEIDWNDNIDLSKSDRQQDFILMPQVGLLASYPLTRYNLLTLNIGLGYDKYISHDEFSTWRLDSGSQLSFDIFVKDWRFDLHDRFQYTQDSARQGDVASTGLYGSFQNAAGISGDWDLEDLVLTFGYDHQNVLSTSPQFEYTDHAAELLVARAGFKLRPQLTAGVETTASFTSYDQKVLNDNANYSAGIYADWHPGHYLQVKPRFGYTIYDVDQTSQFIKATDQNTWYFDLTAAHQLTDYFSYSLSAGHEIRPGIQSDLTEDWYLRPGVNWQAFKNVSLHPALFYERGKISVGSVNIAAAPIPGGNISETYDWYGGSLELGYQLMKKLSVTLTARLTFRSSTLATREYNQNLIGLKLTYQLQ